jgi:two-component system NtrC family response regulator
LQNEIKRAVIATRRSTITEDDMSEAVRTSGTAGGIIRDSSGRSLKEIVAQLETRLIREALNASHHNQLQAARALGLSRQGLIKKMKRYGVT